MTMHSRYQQFLRVVDDLLADHNDRQLLRQLNQTTAILTLNNLIITLLLHCNILMRFVVRTVNVRSKTLE